MNATMLEKIDELTLYSIEMEKANQQQSQELRAVKQNDKQQQAEIDKLKQLVNTVGKKELSSVFMRL